MQELTYNAFGLPSSARVGQGSGQTLVEFDYDITGARVRELSPTHMRLQLATLFQRVTSNDGATEHRHRIWGPHREVAEVVVREEGGEVSRSTVYLHANALGTPEVLTDEGGEVIHRQATDAFGKGEAPVGGGSGVLTSFTGHQHDLELGVVDMRGRLYDASVGRFLTPDPIIQAPFYSQGLNAYSYVFNSPTNFIDPLGLQAQPAGSGGCSAVWGSGLDGSGRPYTVTAEIDGCSPAPQSAPESAPTKAAPATGTEAAIAGAAGLGVGLGLGVGASYATGAFASLACGPGAPLCAGAVTIGITLSLAGAAIYSLWNGGAEQIADSASRLASGEGTVDDYFLGGSLVGGLASGPLAPRFNASGANPGLRLRQLFTGSPAREGGKAFSGIAYELKHIPKHIEGTPAAARLVAKDGSAHVFHDMSTLARVENAIFSEGQFTGVVRGTERFGLTFENPIGTRIGADGSRIPLFYGEATVRPGGLYHIMPRTGPAAP
ncbi:RHS repeat-associated core domain-containing protein [Sorangium sp. So ce327]|uniref:RHS repeat domain-containing protein n=1 Tax=Sorangium sp. So ce327 TaxID=3133301 RepID=UPI003F5D7604